MSVEIPLVILSAPDLKQRLAGFGWKIRVRKLTPETEAIVRELHKRGYAIEWRVTPVVTKRMACKL